MTLLSIDINSDLGESFGVFKLGNDEEVFKYISSANIACGFHGGDYMVMPKTVDLALSAGVAIGAHPGYPDLQRLGRKTMHYTYDELKNMVLYQLGALGAFVTARNAEMRHVKIHGAMGNDAHANAIKGDQTATDAIADAILAYNPRLLVTTFPKSAMKARLQSKGLRVVEEVFADRNYCADGTLVPRGAAEAVITDPQTVVERAIRIIKEQRIVAIDGSIIDGIQPGTVCIHGDTSSVVALTSQLRQALEAEGIAVKAPTA